MPLCTKPSTWTGALGLIHRLGPSDRMVANQRLKLAKPPRVAPRIILQVSCIAPVLYGLSLHQLVGRRSAGGPTSRKHLRIGQSDPASGP